MESQNTKKLTLMIYREKAGMKVLQGADAIIWARIQADALFRIGGTVTVMFDGQIVAQEICNITTLWTAIAFAALGEEFSEE